MSASPSSLVSGAYSWIPQGPRTRKVSRASNPRLRTLGRAPLSPALFSHFRHSLHSFVFDVGVKLAAACQPFASPHLTDASLSLSNLIRSSQTNKSRLLHYFPPSPENPLPAEDEPIDSWCGFHVDHSLLTGLCSVCHPSTPKKGI